MSRVKDLTVKEFRELIGEVVEEKILELVGDPDEGLELRPEIRKRLLKSLHQPRKSRRLISAGEVSRRLGLRL